MADDEARKLQYEYKAVRIFRAIIDLLFIFMIQDYVWAMGYAYEI